MSDRPDGSPTAVDVVLRPEWAAIESKDKLFTASGVALAWEDFISVAYVVPAGKTLYITHASCKINADAAPDADKPQNASFILTAPNIATPVAHLGVNTGGFMQFPRPIRVDAAGTFTVFLYSEANHATFAALSVGGYEV